VHINQQHLSTLTFSTTSCSLSPFSKPATLPPPPTFPFFNLTHTNLTSHPLHTHTHTHTHTPHPNNGSFSGFVLESFKEVQVSHSPHQRFRPFVRSLILGILTNRLVFLGEQSGNPTPAPTTGRKKKKTKGRRQEQKNKKKRGGG